MPHTAPNGGDPLQRPLLLLLLPSSSSSFFFVFFFFIFLEKSTGVGECPEDAEGLLFTGERSQLSNTFIHHNFVVLIYSCTASNMRHIQLHIFFFVGRALLRLARGPIGPLAISRRVFFERRMHKEKGLRVVRLAEKCPSLKRCVLAQMLLVTQQQGKCRCRAVAHSEKLSIAQSATRRGLRTKRVSQKDGGKSLFHHSQKVKKYKNSFFFRTQL